MEPRRDLDVRGRFRLICRSSGGNKTELMSSGFIYLIHEFSKVLDLTFENLKQDSHCGVSCEFVENIFHFINLKMVLKSHYEPRNMLHSDKKMDNVALFPTVILWHT